jgi:hypothetical protein
MKVPAMIRKKRSPGRVIQLGSGGEMERFLAFRFRPALAGRCEIMLDESPMPFLERPACL